MKFLSKIFENLSEDQKKDAKKAFEAKRVTLAGKGRHDSFGKVLRGYCKSGRSEQKYGIAIAETQQSCYCQSRKPCYHMGALILEFEAHSRLEAENPTPSLGFNDDGMLVDMDNVVDVANSIFLTKDESMVDPAFEIDYSDLPESLEEEEVAEEEPCPCPAHHTSKDERASLLLVGIPAGETYMMGGAPKDTRRAIGENPSEDQVDAVATATEGSWYNDVQLYDSAVPASLIEAEKAKVAKKEQQQPAQAQDSSTEKEESEGPVERPVQLVDALNNVIFQTETDDDDIERAILQAQQQIQDDCLAAFVPPEGLEGSLVDDFERLASKGGIIANMFGVVREFAHLLPTKSQARKFWRQLYDFMLFNDKTTTEHDRLTLVHYAEAMLGTAAYDIRRYNGILTVVDQRLGKHRMMQLYTQDVWTMDQEPGDEPIGEKRFLQLKYGYNNWISIGLVNDDMSITPFFGNPELVREAQSWGYFTKPRDESKPRLFKRRADHIKNYSFYEGVEAEAKAKKNSSINSHVHLVDMVVNHTKYSADGWRYSFDERCRKCNTQLTHPTSLDLGIGPECIKKEGFAVVAVAAAAE